MSAAESTYNKRTRSQMDQFAWIKFYCAAMVACPAAPIGVWAGAADDALEAFRKRFPFTEGI